MKLIFTLLSTFMAIPPLDYAYFAQPLMLIATYAKTPTGLLMIMNPEVAGKLRQATWLTRLLRGLEK
jgi:hypothetical protein